MDAYPASNGRFWCFFPLPVGLWCLRCEPVGISELTTGTRSFSPMCPPLSAVASWAPRKKSIGFGRGPGDLSGADGCSATGYPCFSGKSSTLLATFVAMPERDVAMASYFDVSCMSTDSRPGHVGHVGCETFGV